MSTDADDALRGPLTYAYGSDGTGRVFFLKVGDRDVAEVSEAGMRVFFDLIATDLARWGHDTARAHRRLAWAQVARRGQEARAAALGVVQACDELDKRTGGRDG